MERDARLMAAGMSQAMVKMLTGRMRGADAKLIGHAFSVLPVFVV